MSFSSRSRSIHVPRSFAMALRPSRHEYCDMNVALGIAFKPAASATPSSNTRSITWLRRDLPSILSTSADRTAWAAGIILLPGKRHRATSESRSNRASSGRSRNRPPAWVVNSRSASEIIGTSRKPRESSVAEHLLYAGDAEAVLAGLFELVADVVHGEIALAECDDALAHSVLPRLRPRAARNVTE